jgi:hypothetical protein
MRLEANRYGFQYHRKFSPYPAEAENVIQFLRGKMR